MIKEQRKRGVTWKDFDDGHEQCRLQLRSVSRDLSLKLLEQEDQINELKKELETKRGVSLPFGVDLRCLLISTEFICNKGLKVDL